MSYSSSAISRSSLAWLFVAQGFAIAPLFFHLPLWLPVVWLICVGWRIQIYRGAWPFPSSSVKLLLGLVSIFGLAVSYFGFIGVEPMVAFLIVSFVLKLIEVSSEKDVLLVIYIAFIAIAAHFLFYQTIIIAIYSLFSCILVLTAWRGVFSSRKMGVWRQFGAAGVLFVQSIPVMLILFLLLPRLGSLWHVPLAKSTGVTGFSDSMSPGDISLLSQSNDPAFRVSFDSPEHVPAPHLRYWRGLVLDDFDGRKWKRVNNIKTNVFRRSGFQRKRPTLEYDSASIQRYQVLLEPHQQLWLFTLMVPVNVTSSLMDVDIVDDYLAMSSRPIAGRTEYQVVSYRRYLAAPDKISNTLRNQNLFLPEGENPRAKALVESWRAQGMNDEAIIAQALATYRDNFSYTLQPPVLGRNSVDQFLFETRQGFCEHFASSFTVLMRAAGIPSRVVVGYQGGVFNEQEQYMLIRQSDAHAWSEVWMPEKGWVRIDPTAVVAPDRIERGLTDSLSEEDQRLLSADLWSYSIVRALAQRLDAISFVWHKWVLSYDSNTQSSFLRVLLGGVEGWRVGLFFIGSCAVLGFLYFLSLGVFSRVRYNSVEQALYFRYLRVLERHGIPVLPGETPTQLAERVGELKPQWRSHVKLIAQLFNKAAYQEDVSATDDLRKQVLAFRRLSRTS